MFSILNKSKRFDSEPASPAQEDIARLAITSDGRIAYASAAFCAFAETTLQDLQKAQAQDLFSIGGSNGPITEIKAGLYQIAMHGRPEPRSFHFDWLKAPDNQRYLIGFESTNQSQKPSQSAFENFAEGLSAPLSPQALHFLPQENEVFLNMSADCMALVDDQGCILKINAHFETILGYTLADLEALTLSDLFVAEEFNSEHHSDQAYEARVNTKSGKIRWMEWKQRREGDYLYLTGHDITPLKKQKKALERREKQLSEAESIGRMGHWHWTIGGTAMEWSDELYRIFGVEKNHFKPTLETLNKMVHRSDIARLNQGFQRALIEENDYDMEFRVLTKDGGVRYIRCEGRCARDSEGEVDALFGIMQDMTERVLYEKELKQSKNVAERAYAARTQFLANMSHELRTPLNAIIGFSEMMERQILGPIGTPKYLEYISGIRESGEHLLDLISDILDMSKIEAGKYELDLEELQPAALIKLALHMMEGRAHEARIKITSDIQAPDHLKIIADRRAVLQILLNLLSNAVKFSNPGQPITVTLLERENHCLIKVTDQGMGIPANKLASITKPFEQVSASYTREHEGSGLGLAITKELAEMHDGALFIESKLGEGTTVTVRLPYVPQKAKPKVKSK
jgi:two-component system cell cycle sensor histidine kinase PleC